MATMHFRLRMVPVGLIWVGLSVAWFLPSGRAEFELVIYGNGSGGTPDPGTVNFSYTESLLGTTSGVLAQTGSGDGNGTHFANTISEVQAGSTFDDFLSLYGYAENERAGTFVPAGQASAVALWRDVVTLSGTPPLPAAIQLHFAVSGVMTSQTNGALNALTRNTFSARGTSDVSKFAGQSNATFYAERPLAVNNALEPTTVRYEVGDSFNLTEPKIENWSTVTDLGSGAFAGTFALDVDFDVALDAYDWAVLFTAYSRTQGGEALTDVNAVSLLDVTDVAGGALDGFTVDFASGRSLSSSPPLEGDFDADGDVDGADFLVWQRGIGGAAPNPAQLALWQPNYGQPTGSAVGVPEPRAMLLLVSALVVLSLGRISRSISSCQPV